MSQQNLSIPLGLAFLFVIASSMFGGSFFMTYTSSSAIAESLTALAENVDLLRTSVIVDMFTAMGIVTLGALLYLTLRKKAPTFAMIALLLFVLEAVSMVYSRFIVVQVLQLSLEYVSERRALEDTFYFSMGRMLVDSAVFSYQIHFLFYCVGMLLFAYAIIRAKIIPQWIPIFGFVVVLIGLVGSLFQVLGNYVPLFVFLPILPYELIIGVYFVVRGMQQKNRHIVKAC